MGGWVRLGVPHPGSSTPGVPPRGMWRAERMHLTRLHPDLATKAGGLMPGVAPLTTGAAHSGRG